MAAGRHLLRAEVSLPALRKVPRISQEAAGAVVAHAGVCQGLGATPSHEKGGKAEMLIHGAVGQSQ